MIIKEYMKIHNSEIQNSVSPVNFYIASMIAGSKPKNSNS